MSSPREPGRDLRLERLDQRDGQRPAPLGDAAQVGAPLASAQESRDFLAAYQALIDAVFLAPGAAEWLFGLRVAVTMFLADKEAPPAAPPLQPVARDAIQAADPGVRRA